MNALDEPAPHAAPPDARDESELDGAHRLALEFGNQQPLVGIGVYGRQCIEIGRIAGVGRVVLGLDDRVLDIEADDEGQVGRRGVAIIEAGHRVTERLIDAGQAGLPYAQ